MSKSLKTNILLTGDQLVEHSKKIEKFAFVSRGNKIGSLDEVDGAQNEGRSEECLKNLQNLLRFEHVILSNKISKGIYELDKNRVKIVTHLGKWNVGYHEDQVNYLKPHEALHLIEMGKLEVTFEGVIISIEQAYTIFLSSGNEVSFEDYLVYSHLIRAGYFVQIHNSENDRQKFEAAKMRATNKEDEMIFCVLREKLNQGASEELIKNEQQLYLETKASMEMACKRISGDRNNEEDHPESSTAKRKFPNSNTQASKRLKTDVETSHNSSFIDILKNESEFLSYQHVFNKFTFIKRAENFPMSGNKINFRFDVFLPKMNFKRTEDLPNYRILIIKSTEKFPSNAELENLRRQQHYELPIIIAIVSESSTLHFCLCSF